MNADKTLLTPLCKRLGATLSRRGMLFVGLGIVIIMSAAARLAGTRPFRIMVMHILPNALTPVLVSATLGIAGAILVESSLSFLGLGVQPPDPSWGNMLMEGKDVLEIAPWLSLYPGLAILITVLGYNLLGESLRDTLDPRLKR